MSPQRVQLRRTKGWRKPEGAVVVARPTRWGNPFAIHTPEIVVHPDGRSWWCPGDGARREAVELFRSEVLSTLDLEPLRGHDLACWCPLDQPCHADALLEAANPQTERTTGRYSDRSTVAPTIASTLTPCSLSESESESEVSTSVPANTHVSATRRLR